MREVYELGRAITAEEYINAQAARTTFYRWAQEFMSGYDGLLTASMPVGAWPIRNTVFELGGKAVSPVAGGRWPLQYIFNVTGWPGASVPAGFTAEGLPVGLQIVTPWHQDDRCLALSAAYESVRPWANRPFPV
jgi:Asp-tRNA(Asn)/Glu-tRNA(Gln) amidotransferase A subunit family amidase